MLASGGCAPPVPLRCARGSRSWCLGTQPSSVISAGGKTELSCSCRSCFSHCGSPTHGLFGACAPTHCAHDQERFSSGGRLRFSHLHSLLFPARSDLLRRRPAVGHCYALVALLQIALVAGAMTTYYSMRREPEDLQILATRLWVPIVGITAAAIVIPNLFLHEGVPYEASAVGLLRTINVAEAEYAQAHPDKGFASSLAELGPEPGSALIDSVLASGRKSGYVFILTAAPPDSHGRITHYTVIARPQKYRREVKHSFLTDESGVQHFTTEDRAPTAQDPALQ